MPGTGSASRSSPRSCQGDLAGRPGTRLLRPAEVLSVGWSEAWIFTVRPRQAHGRSASRIRCAATDE